MKVFLVDAYDSFVFIISQYLEELGLQTRVERNDSVDLVLLIEEFKPDFLLLGPGPGHPSDAGYIQLIRHFEGRIPILGICLGHQAIGLAYGASIEGAKNIMHGKISMIENDGKGVYSHTEGTAIQATRYHSLIVSDKGIPDCLEVSSRCTTDNYVMGLRHRSFPVEGVQYHPESILTKEGIRIFQSFIENYCL